MKETGILKRNVFGGTIDSVLYSNLKGGGIAPRSYLPTAKKQGKKKKNFATCQPINIKKKKKTATTPPNPNEFFPLFEQ